MSGSSQSGGRFPEESIYLDHAAATPLAAEVAAAMAEAAGCFANPSSPHAAGRRAKRLLEEAREEILSILGGRTGGASRDRLVFTSGASEANQLGLLGIAGDDPGWIGVSAHDHSSIRAAADRLAAAGWQRRELPLCQEGKLTADSLAEALDGGSGGQRILARTTV
jgi:cysteine desulfurase